MRVRLGGARHPHARPAAALRLPAAYDLLDVPAAAGHRVLLQLERVGAPLGPVLSVRAAGAGHEAGCGRLQFFVEAGSTASFLADLKDLGWDPGETDIATVGVVLAAETPLPPAGSARWVRAPETREGLPVTLPPARLLLGALAHACRRAARASGDAVFAGCRG